MNEQTAIKTLKSALQTILFESKEPHIKVYAESALHETTPNVEKNAACLTHHWFGLYGETCPICQKQKSKS